jgi:hypothetical protein
MFRCGETKPS